ncbi:MAG TPA: hypothetical protein VM386_05530, partial [Acidimicrobiales bacterium]|nr:hypothetical protein [Acidimicrobiales bacterium]
VAAVTRVERQGCGASGCRDEKIHRSRAYGRLYAAVVASGRKARGTRAVDLLIAATACAANLPLYTRNRGDLRAVEELVEVIPL